MTLYCDEPFEQLWQGKDPFQEAAALQGKIYRSKEGRRTLRFELDGKGYFLKYHSGIGWLEIFKNLFQLRLPVLGASNEFNAAKRLSELGIDTLTPVAYGERGNNPAHRQSYLITQELQDTISLEDLTINWSSQPPPFHLKQTLLAKVTDITNTMHQAGINHRDFYLCHFLVHDNAIEQISSNADFKCYLIDLHRCQLRIQVPCRWLEKDLAGLLYSCMDIGLTRRDLLRFIKRYTGKSLREGLKVHNWSRINDKAVKLYLKDFGKLPPKLFLAGAHSG